MAKGILAGSAKYECGREATGDRLEVHPGAVAKKMADDVSIRPASILVSRLPVDTRLEACYVPRQLQMGSRGLNQSTNSASDWKL